MNEEEKVLPDYSFEAASFASWVAEAHRRNKGDSRDLFVAYVGLVSSQDKQLASKCLIALEEAVFQASAPAYGKPMQLRGV